VTVPDLAEWWPVVALVAWHEAAALRGELRLLRATLTQSAAPAPVEPAPGLVQAVIEALDKAGRLPGVGRAAAAAALALGLAVGAREVVNGL